MKREANFGTLFRHWLRAQNWLSSCAFELKQTQTDSIPFSDVQPHQIAALEAAMTDGILYKIPDDSRAVKPFDFFFLRAVPGYIAIRYPKFFCLILVNVFVAERQKSDRKSLTAERARHIALHVVEL